MWGRFRYTQKHLNVTFLTLVAVVTHHKLLLVASHAGTPLGVLVGPDEQLDQTGDGPLFPQSAVIGWTQSQVADEAHCGLEREGGF